MGSRENETALWLHNKLGSTDDLWSGRSISSQISKERLQDILGCFRSLQAHVKVKLLLSFLHILRRNVAEWKTLLDEIIELACSDRDQWVSTTGEILKTYPSKFLVNTSDLSGSSTFHSMYSELKKAVRKSGESHTLPIECTCLGKSALAAAISHAPHSVKHFNIKRKPKAATLRADLLNKSQEIQSSTKKGIPIGTIPMKVRSNAKRMDDEIKMPTHTPSAQRNGGSNTGFLKANTLSSLGSAPRTASSIGMRKEGGAKMLDISEMPPTGKEAKRRKKAEEQEAAAQAKKEREEALAAEKAAAAAQATPDYAAGLGSTAAPKITGIPRTPKAKAPPCTVPSYLPVVTQRLPLVTDYPHPYCYHQHNMMPCYNYHSNGGYPTAAYARELASTLPSASLQPPTNRPVPHSTPIAPAQPIRLRSPAPASFQPRPVASQSAVPAMGVPQPARVAQPAESPAATASQQSVKKPLSLTKEQMIEAQEMFKNSNKVTRPEKALILGFMAGSRENPCPQQGHIVNIRLSEKIEPVRLQDNSVREMMSETFFQMNYQSGEWRRIKKFKEAPHIS